MLFALQRIDILQELGNRCCLSSSIITANLQPRINQDKTVTVDNRLVYRTGIIGSKFCDADPETFKDQLI